LRFESAGIPHERVVNEPGLTLSNGFIKIPVPDYAAAPVFYRSGIVCVAFAERVNEHLDVATQSIDTGGHATADVDEKDEIDNTFGLLPRLNGRRGSGFVRAQRYFRTSIGSRLYQLCGQSVWCG
jgi:hypothetical protein